MSGSSSKKKLMRFYPRGYDSRAVAAEIVESILFDLANRGYTWKAGPQEVVRMEWRRLAENVLRGGA